MGVSKVVYNNKTIIDLTTDTVTAASLDKGIVAHDKAGNVVTGTRPVTWGGLGAVSSPVTWGYLKNNS